MGLFIKIFAGFWFLWLIWYLTGGPLRDDVSKPFIGPTGSSGQFETFGTSTGK